MVDAVGDDLFDDLRAFRKSPGEPSANRMEGLFELTELLGEGNPERAFDALQRYNEQYGGDPQSNLGAFFYLAGWSVGLETLDQRLRRYAQTFHCAKETGWRRCDRGIRQLAAMIRDQSESSRPWAVVSIFQSGKQFQPFLDFNLGHEAWRHPVIQLDGRELEGLDFVVHRAEAPRGKPRYTSRIILPEAPLRLDVQFGEPMARVRVIWAMPVWPVWNVVSWTADPRILTRLRTFRQRAVEVSLEWWRKTPPAEVTGLVTDGAVWAERTDPNRLVLPPGWSLTRPSK